MLVLRKVGVKEDVMTVQKSAGGLDFEAMRRAIEQLDADLLTSLYADDAEHLRDVCGRAMTHRVENEVVGEERVAFNEACEYSDGVRVLAATTLDVRDGKVVRQVNIEAWDE